MREIKFRIWDKLAKQFITYDKGYQGHYILSLKGEFYNLQNGSGGDDYIVQQYIGLKDKNGVEIYEGDIIKLASAYYYLYEEVVYEPQGSGFGFFMHDDENRDNAAFKFLSDWTGSVCYEVIGNTFENPELLEA